MLHLNRKHQKNFYGVFECNYMNSSSNHLLNIPFRQSKKELLHYIRKLTFRSKNKNELYYVTELWILALKFLFYFYCWRNAVKNDLIAPDLPLLGAFNDNKKSFSLVFQKWDDLWKNITLTYS